MVAGVPECSAGKDCSGWGQSSLRVISKLRATFVLRSDDARLSELTRVAGELPAAF